MPESGCQWGKQAEAGFDALTDADFAQIRRLVAGAGDRRHWGQAAFPQTRAVAATDRHAGIGFEIMDTSSTCPHLQHSGCRGQASRGSADARLIACGHAVCHPKARLRPSQNVFRLSIQRPRRRPPHVGQARSRIQFCPPPAARLFPVAGLKGKIVVLYFYPKDNTPELYHRGESPPRSTATSMQPAP